MIYIKKLKKNEKLKIEAVEVLPESKEFMLPHLVLGDVCVTPMAKAISMYQHPDPIKMTELLRKWYQQTVNTYSEGIYSFVRKGRTKRTPDTPYYIYIKREIDSIISATSLKEEYSDLEKLAREMWETGYERYKDTYFWSYNLLHGDLHSGNIVSFRGKYRLIDWENFRSGPKETELAFYLCWDYLRWGEDHRNLQELLHEIDIFLQNGLIHEYEKERILYCLIPMWMLILVLHLNNGNLMFEADRKKACGHIIPLYKKTIFDKRPWKEQDADE